MRSRNIGYLEDTLKIILIDEARSQKERIQKYLCCALLSRFDDMQRDYKFLKDYKDLKDVVAFLAFVFKVENNTMKEILDKLQDYKNINNSCVQSCLSIKL
ncbi:MULTISPECIES: hypothetical protein [Helicobacter]|uniref:hypothetical protein n=1 Tax=Helicobacter TaxID=209 RepID=UPI00260DE24E|nr:hypothetical protein [Helicobacter sp. UBA3407]